MKEYPWFKFFPNDWQANPKLAMCSIAARGLWLEMLCIMHQAEPYGYLIIAGKVPTDEQLSSIVRVPVEELQKLLLELSENEVFSKKKSGVIYSRKLARMVEKSRKSQENGAKGGNPKLGKATEKIGKNDSRLSERLTRDLSPRSQIREAKIITKLTLRRAAHRDNRRGNCLIPECSI